MGTVALACPGVTSNGIISGKFCDFLPLTPDPPLLGAPSKFPDDDDDDLEALVVLSIITNVLLIEEKQRVFWRFLILRRIT